MAPVQHWELCGERTEDATVGGCVVTYTGHQWRKTYVNGRTEVKYTNGRTFARASNSWPQYKRRCDMDGTARVVAPPESPPSPAVKIELSTAPLLGAPADAVAAHDESDEEEMEISPDPPPHPDAQDEDAHAAPHADPVAAQASPPSQQLALRLFDVGQDLSSDEEWDVEQ